ncbi:Oxysterol-binding protein-related protein 11 [Trichoplax sp. H2]|nr:Oxysterol-binding protein-related protein 11 [Trichoplax sp. H2]|eukprot:RDD41793.1 Oxysterol-binding protein-related protein 11 [Trichoplax sp. H2]
MESEMEPEIEPEVLQPSLIQNNDKLSKEEQSTILAVMQRAKTFEEQTVMSKVYEGSLLKYTNVVKGWQNRWFVLDFQKGTLTYFLTEDKRKQNNPRGSLPLSGALISPSDEDSQSFGIHASTAEVYKIKAHYDRHKQLCVHVLLMFSTLYVQTADAKSRQAWILRLRKCAEHHTKKIALPHLSTTNAPTPARKSVVPQVPTRPPPPSPNEPPNVQAPHVAAASNTTRQINAHSDNQNVTQPQTIGSRITSLMSYTPSFRSKERPPFATRRSSTGGSTALDAKLKKLLSNAEVHCLNFREHLERCPLSGGALNIVDDIVLLLNATSAATIDVLSDCAKLLQQRVAEQQHMAGLPVGNTIKWYTPQRNPSDNQKDAKAANISIKTSAVNPQAKKELFSDEMKVSSETKESSIHTIPADQNTANNINVSNTTKSVLNNAENPRTRKDSSQISEESDNEVLFEMANESQENQGVIAASDKSSNIQFGAVIDLQSQQGSQLISNADVDETLDLDDIYGDDADESSDTGEEHKSVIMHLLGQLKLGMDLTKVTLPTFILERRSLLEMYADFFAHPDLFLRIVDGLTPKERMLYVIEWYLTSFHSGRKGSVAKKPYNPIIGETFHCSWNLNNVQNDLGGPPQTGDLSFVAEQVSHHPPVSGFYAECESKRMCLNAHIWTKSKFQGISIGVANVGEAVLSLIDFGEDYVFTLPSAYCRSILTVPWVELGGKVTVECAATNYSAALTFHTKPFYGGKINRISGDIKHPSGQIMYRINGEWNGTMEITDTAEVNKVINTKALPVVSKIVQPLRSQGEFESRRLWRHVTKALKNKDVDSATKYKRTLEDRQRSEARQRKEENKEWETKYFQKRGDGWLYSNNLKSREENLI